MKAREGRPTQRGETCTCAQQRRQLVIHEPWLREKKVQRTTNESHQLLPGRRKEATDDFSREDAMFVLFWVPQHPRLDQLPVQSGRVLMTLHLLAQDG